MTMPEDSAAADAERIAGEIETEICELPDRTSPEGQPDLLLVTVGELRAIIVAIAKPYLAARDAALREARAEIELFSQTELR